MGLLCLHMESRFTEKGIVWYEMKSSWILFLLILKVKLKLVQQI